MIAISSDQLTKIQTQAEKAYPQECCGLLIGRINTDGFLSVTRIAASPNMAEGSQKDSFEVDPQIRFEVMRDIRHTTEDIIGHYHSHPDHPAEPSQTDLDMAFEPDFVWLIVAVEDGQASDTKAWRLHQETRAVTSVPLLVSESG